MPNINHINQIVNSTVNEALSHGWSLSVYCEGYLIRNSTDKKAIVEHILSVDESTVYFDSPNECKGSFYFVFDCDGYDCINDMSDFLCPETTFPKTMALVDKLGG